MVDKGYLGEKTGGSFFRDKRTMCIDPSTCEYRPWQVPQQESLLEANKISDPVARVRKFISYDDNAAQFGWDLLAATFVYSANRVPEICDDIAQIDRGMRWGYAWDLGPFELWDALGVTETVERMTNEGRLVPEWVVALAESDDPHFYKKDGAVLTAYGPAKKHLPLASRPRQISLADLKAAGKTLDESPAAGLIDLGDRVACLEFRTKAGMMTEDVHRFLEKILAQAGRDYDALVIGHQGPHFSGGADMKYMADRINAGDFDAIDATIRYVQKTSMALKYSPIPVVAAPFGRVLGGGLEICLHCDRIQAQADVAMGLVETSVGLIPSAGGIKESLIRGMDVLKGVVWPWPNLMPAFEALAQAKVTGSAWEAFDLNYMRKGDGVTMNREGVIYAAKQVALGMLGAGYQPPVPAKVKVMGYDGIGNFRSILYNMGQSQFISEHDRYLGEKVAFVLSGGDVDPQTEVDEWYLLHLERKTFLEVCRQPKSLERMQAMLTTGKPLRN
jgi:3-hydroxyacyl-CoA dehydrogenase